MIGFALLSAFVMGTAAQQDIPQPRGYVNDFAGVIGADRAARIARIVDDVRAKSGGEITVVTLANIGDRDVGDVALQIGRQWKVGAAAEAGDRRRNTGMVILVVPKETSSDGKGHISLMTGNGVEGFITDSHAGDIRREATPLLIAKDYGAAIELMTLRVAQAYSTEFNFALDSANEVAPPPSRRQPGGLPPGLFVLGFIVLMMLLGGRGRGGNGCLWFMLGQALGGGRGGFGGGGFGGGGGGFGGGGFGGFGGGGGFSGGGSSGSW